MIPSEPKRAFDTLSPKRGMIVWLNDVAYQRLHPADTYVHAWAILQANWLNERPGHGNVLIAPFTSWKEGDPEKSGSLNVLVDPPYTEVKSFILCSEIQTVKIDDVERAIYKKRFPNKIEEDLIYALCSIFSIPI